MNIEAPTKETSMVEIGSDIASRLREFSAAVAQDADWLDEAIEAYQNANSDDERDRAVDVLDDRVRVVCAEVLSLGGGCE